MNKRQLEHSKALLDEAPPLLLPLSLVFGSLRSARRAFRGSSETLYETSGHLAVRLSRIVPRVLGPLGEGDVKKV